MDEDKIKEINITGRALARKINNAVTIDTLNDLRNEVEKYSKFVNESVGAVDEFSYNTNEKYCDLSFYIHMALKEKIDNLDYYIIHHNEVSRGVADFLNYLSSDEWR